VYSDGESATSLAFRVILVRLGVNVAEERGAGTVVAVSSRIANCLCSLAPTSSMLMSAVSYGMLSGLTVLLDADRPKRTPYRRFCPVEASFSLAGRCSGESSIDEGGIFLVFRIHSAARCSASSSCSMVIDSLT
jgi:hypothetical protein